MVMVKPAEVDTLTTARQLVIQGWGMVRLVGGHWTGGQMISAGPHQAAVAEILQLGARLYGGPGVRWCQVSRGVR